MKVAIVIMGIICCAACITSCSANSSQPTTVQINTSQGIMIAELFTSQAPQTTQNFLEYVQEGFYNNTIFHRVIPDFMVQGGGYNLQKEKKETKQAIPLEVSAQIANNFGTLAMARTANPDSATSQFFINTANNSFLNPSRNQAGYSVFGKLIKGEDVLRAIERVPTKNTPQPDWPQEPVIIHSITIIKK